MLYEHAISALNDAIEAIERGDIERRFQSNKKAVEIIAHLAMTLDMERGGQIAENLAHLYRFMMQQLVNVDVRNDPKPARDVIGLLEPLCTSWRRVGQPASSPTRKPFGPNSRPHHRTTNPAAILELRPAELPSPPDPKSRFPFQRYDAAGRTPSVGGFHFRD